MSSSNASNLLDPVAISRAESLGLNARFIVEGYMAGEHKSPYRGFAIEFAYTANTSGAKPAAFRRKGTDVRSTIAIFSRN